MNASELAEKMLLWEKNKIELDALGAEIEAEVLKLEKTQVVGGVRVTYSGGRSTYDYSTPCLTVDETIKAKFATEREVVDWNAVADEAPEIVKKFTTIETDYDYKSICKEANIKPVVLSKSDPTATIKLDK